MDKLNIGLIGGGFMGKAHSLAYASMPMFFWPAPAIPQRYVIADLTDELAAESARRFGWERSVGDWRRLVEDPAVDVVDIATPNDTHLELAVAAAEAGKHIICEKPLARSAAESLEMVEAVEKAGVINMCAFSYRRVPAIAFAKKLIDEGAIGKVLNFRGEYLSDWSAGPETPLSWRFDKAVAGSGTIGDIASHALDCARFLVGDIAAVQAIAKTYIGERPLPSGGPDLMGGAVADANAARGTVDVDDEVVSMLRFANGAIGSMEATRNSYGRKNYLTCEVHGTKGSIYFNYERRDELQVALADDPSDQQGFKTIYMGPHHPYGSALWPNAGLGIGFGETKIVECYELCRAIAEGGPASPTFRDGYVIAQLCDALLESSESQAWVELEAPSPASHGNPHASPIGGDR